MCKQTNQVITGRLWILLYKYCTIQYIIMWVILC